MGCFLTCSMGYIENKSAINSFFLLFNVWNMVCLILIFFSNTISFSCKSSIPTSCRWNASSRSILRFSISCFFRFIFSVFCASNFFCWITLYSFSTRFDLCWFNSRFSRNPLSSWSNISWTFCLISFEDVCVSNMQSIKVFNLFKKRLVLWFTQKVIKLTL